MSDSIAPLDTLSQQSTPPPTPEEAQAIKDKYRDELEWGIELTRRLMISGVIRAPEIKLWLEKYKVKVNERTVYRYKNVVKRRQAQAVRKEIGTAQTVEEVAYKFKQIMEDVNRELWLVVRSASSSAPARVAALKAINETARETIKMMQSLGITFTEPTHIKMTETDGKPLEPSKVKDQLNADFTSWLKAKYQDPNGMNVQPAPAATTPPTQVIPVQSLT